MLQSTATSSAASGAAYNAASEAASRALSNAVSKAASGAASKRKACPLLDAFDVEKPEPLIEVAIIAIVTARSLETDRIVVCLPIKRKSYKLDSCRNVNTNVYIQYTYKIKDEENRTRLQDRNLLYSINNQTFRNWKEGTIHIKLGKGQPITMVFKTNKTSIT